MVRSMYNASQFLSQRAAALIVLLTVSACGSSQTGTQTPENKDSGGSTTQTGGSTDSNTKGTDATNTKTDGKAGAPGGTSSTGASGTNSGPDEDKPYRLTLFEVDRPPFAYTLKTAVKVSASPAPTLTQVSEKKNKLANESEWFDKNGLSLAGRKPTNGPSYPKPPADGYEGSGNEKLHFVLDHGDHSILMYGANFSSMKSLLLLDKNQIARGQFDFSAWMKPPEVVAGEENFTQMEVSWAQKVDDVLYMSMAHHTFAKSSKGKNAFVSAIDAENGELRWQSDPLVCNSVNFVVYGAYILCGYGFSKEEDFIYVISRADGKTISKTPIKQGPTYLVLKGKQLFVRAYDTDYVFDVK